MRHHAVPNDLAVAPHAVGFPDEIRYFPRDPGDAELMTKEFVDSWEREKPISASAFCHRRHTPPSLAGPTTARLLSKRLLKCHVPV